MFCVLCFIAKKSNANLLSFSAQSGWNIIRGWGKLKDKIPSHENSTLHKENYVAKKSASKAARAEKSVDDLLLTVLSAESNPGNVQFLQLHSTKVGDFKYTYACFFAHHVRNKMVCSYRQWQTSCSAFTCN